jgi:hypothetical protein
MLATPFEDSHYWPKHVKVNFNILLLNLLQLMELETHSRISHHTILPDFLSPYREYLQGVDKIMEILRN